MDENKEREAAKYLIRELVALLDYSEYYDDEDLEIAIKMVMEYKANGR